MSDVRQKTMLPRGCPERVLPGPVSVRRFFLQTWRDIFSTNLNYGVYQKSLSCFTWKQGLEVELDAIDDLSAKKDYRPAVKIGLGDWSLGRVTVNHEGALLDDLSGQVDFMDTNLPVVLHHVMPSSDAAYQLAEISLAAAFGARRYIMDTLRLRELEINRVGRPQPLTGSPEKFYTADINLSLLFTYHVEWRWESRRLKRYESSIDTKPA